jgi:hypothetical protein
MKKRFFMLLALCACSPDAPKIVGTWQNRDHQVLSIGPTLHGKLSQIAKCGPPLDVRVYRDPFDAYAIQFDINQLIYIPPRELQFFQGAEFFCADQDSDPMCNFCRIDGKTMTCNSTDQKITGFGEPVTHDCVWTQISTAITSTVTGGFRLPGSCPTSPNDGGCGTPGLQPIDASTAMDAASTMDAASDGGTDAGRG